MAESCRLLPQLHRNGTFALPDAFDDEPSFAVTKVRVLTSESQRKCLRREIGEELPKLNVGLMKRWKEVKAKNRRSGRKVSDAIFVAKKVSGRLKIGDKREIDKAAWRKPRGIRLTPTSRYIRDK
ncbi:NUDIX hydrolase [Bradyrhizobium sp. 186]|uniref:NUDIX domain-containing protein n=1 Tax=Bradyrhizobium sp. 186 TaxID=2782654 RepID=UPI002001AFC5|nr:NUDIX domain-containing protein [Bradyrhizobium sp. 186]UPK33132.1 NUDIX hydrolase [Bradyrhizobium sp. 186]